MTSNDPHKSRSKFMSMVLRHKPEKIGLTLDANGWAKIDDLVRLSKGRLTKELVVLVTDQNDKKRFAISEDGLSVRANQGHSIAIDLELKAIEPPKLLYHGTASRFIESIRQSGLTRQKRQHVHLSLDRETATKVGQRHGKPVILEIRSAEMQAAGLQFFRSENGVWLTGSVPLEYIDFPE